MQGMKGLLIMGSRGKVLVLLLLLMMLFASTVGAQPLELPGMEIDFTGEGGDLSLPIQILILLTILSLAPAILIMVTSFTRIVVVLALIRNALATQQMPPNQVLVGLALFLTFFIMAPDLGEINEQALQPYLEGEMPQEEALEVGIQPLRDFMFRQTREKDVALFYNLTDRDRPQNPDDVETHVLIPAFIISELKKAFQIAFMIYIPFVMIDMAVASILMSMGMLMLPPVMISLPFKILLFVLIDGWYLVIRSLMETFN